MGGAGLPSGACGIDVDEAIGGLPRRPETDAQSTQEPFDLEVDEALEALEEMIKEAETVWSSLKESSRLHMITKLEVRLGSRSVKCASGCCR